jgi:ubiquinone/menaquinone biosynthesis C-methylase UbiE
MRQPRGITKKICDYFYPLGKNKDDNDIFFQWVGSYIKQDSVILDCGAGTGKLHLYDFKNKCHKIIGVDLDKKVLDNPLLNESYQADILKLPFSDNTFDIIFANNVVEHIKEPVLFLKEIKRVLKKDGLFFFKTSNKKHYVALISSITPTCFHKFYNKLRGTNETDIFPTFYKINYPSVIKKLSKKLNFSYQLRYFEGRPNYLLLNPLFLIIGLIYEKIVNYFSLLKSWRSVIMAKIEFK